MGLITLFPLTKLFCMAFDSDMLHSIVASIVRQKTALPGNTTSMTTKACFTTIYSTKVQIHMFAMYVETVNRPF